MIILKIPLSLPALVTPDLIGAHVQGPGQRGHVIGVSGTAVAIDSSTPSGWFGSNQRSEIDVRVRIVQAKHLDLDLTVPSSRIALRRWMQNAHGPEWTWARRVAPAMLQGPAHSAISPFGLEEAIIEAVNPSRLLTDTWWTDDRITVLASIAMILADW